MIMLKMAIAKFYGKSPEVLVTLLKKREEDLKWGKETNMMGSGRLLELEIEIQAIKILLKKY